MTTFVEARDALVTLIETDFSGYRVFYENTTEVDLDTVGDRFIKVEIEFVGAAQASIGQNPADRTYGLLTFSVFTKAGQGVRTTLQVLDTLKNIVRFKNIAKVQLQHVEPGDVERKSGWECRYLHVPFWFDSFS